MTKKHVLNQHDKFAKTSLEHKEIAQDFFKAHLPEELQEHIEWKTLALQSGSFIDDDYRDKYTDILYRVDMFNQPGYLLILTEHQSTADRYMALRLLNYLCKIWERHAKQHPKPDKQTRDKEGLLPLVYPITLYHGKVSPYPYSLDILDLFAHKGLAKSVLHNPFPLVDLTNIDDNTLTKHGRAAVMEMIQKYIFQRDIMPAIKQLAQLGRFELIEALDDGKYVIKVVNYALSKGEMPSPEKLLETIIQAIPEQEDNIMTGADMLRQQGREQGVQQGMKQGMKQGIHQVAKNMLAEGIDSSLVAKTTGISSDSIEKIINELHS